MELAARIGTMAASGTTDGLWTLGCVFGASKVPAYPCVLNHWIKLSGGGHSLTWTNACSISFGGLMLQLDENKNYINYANGSRNRTLTMDSRTVYLGVCSYYDDERYKNFTLYDNTDGEWLFKDGQIMPGHDGGPVIE